MACWLEYSTVVDEETAWQLAGSLNDSLALFNLIHGVVVSNADKMTCLVLRNQTGQNGMHANVPSHGQNVSQGNISYCYRTTFTRSLLGGAYKGDRTLLKLSL